MTLFADRERAFENFFVHEEGLRFLAKARRNRLVACWAAERLGLRGHANHEYVRALVDTVLKRDCDSRLIERVLRDLVGTDAEVQDQEVLAAMDEAAREAVRQVRADIHAHPP